MEPESAVPTALERTRRLIDTAFEDSLDIDTLCEVAHFSRYHFIRAFRSAYRETPHQYLVRRRIDRAKELLALSDLSVTDICFEVGFESLGSFSALFRRLVGWPPSVYRARSIERQQAPRRFIPACCWLMYGFEKDARAQAPAG